MFCYKCGEKLVESASFCSTCGEDIAATQHGAPAAPHDAPTAPHDAPVYGPPPLPAKKSNIKIPVIIGIIIAAGLIAYFVFSASSLVGRWEATHVIYTGTGETYTNEFSRDELVLELFSNGTGYMIDGTIREEFLWRTERKTLILSSYGEPMIFQYDLSGSTLRLTEDSTDKYAVSDSDLVQPGSRQYISIYVFRRS